MLSRQEQMTRIPRALIAPAEALLLRDACLYRSSGIRSKALGVQYLRQFRPIIQLSKGMECAV